MTATNMIDIQNAIIQMQARATNQLFNVLNMYTEQESAPVKLDKVIELQGDVLEKLKEGLLEHISVEELQGIQCMKELDVCAGLKRTISGEGFGPSPF